MKKANKKANAAIIIIGNEILSGRTQDVNVVSISKWLNKLGVKVEEVRTIPDLEDSIVKTINDVKKKFKYIFTTGGIGPTHDDVTSLSIAKAFKVKLIKNKHAVKFLKIYYASMKKQLNESRLKMAFIPKGAELLYNSITKVAGFRMKNVYAMAGIPQIMEAMFKEIISKIKKGVPYISKTILINAPESNIAKDLSNIQKDFKEVEVGSYPFLNKKLKGVNIVLRSKNKDEINKAAKEIREIIKI